MGVVGSAPGQGALWDTIGGWGHYQGGLRLCGRFSSQMGNEGYGGSWDNCRGQGVGGFSGVLQGLVGTGGGWGTLKDTARSCWHLGGGSWRLCSLLDTVGGRGHYWQTGGFAAGWEGTVGHFWKLGSLLGVLNALQQAWGVGALGELGGTVKGWETLLEVGGYCGKLGALRGLENTVGG